MGSLSLLQGIFLTQGSNLGLPHCKQILYHLSHQTSLVAQRLTHLPAMWETRVRFLGGEDSPGEGNGNPLQYSCLENPMDRGAWQDSRWGRTESDTTEGTKQALIRQRQDQEMNTALFRDLH